MTVSKEIIRPIKSGIRSLMVATAILYICLLGAGAYVYFEGRATHNALCAFQSDLVVRVESEEKFLNEHPKGIDGVTPKSIRETIDNQKRTVATLSSLSC